MTYPSSPPSPSPAPILLIARSFTAWMAFVILSLSILITKSDAKHRSYYRFGWSPEFIVMGFQVDHPAKYFGIVFYTLINSIFRAVHHNFLSPWLINNIQDEERDKSHIQPRFAYEIASIITLYTWIDWLLYINLLMAQIDMVIFEIGTDMIMSYIITYYYMNSAEFKPLLALTI